MKKQKFDVDFWDIAIKAAVAFFALLLAFAFFGPEDGKMRNLPLLCVLLALVTLPWAVNAVRNVRLLLKI